MSDPVKTYKVLIADDHELVVDGYKSALTSLPEFDVIGQAGNGKEVETFLETNTPDLIILDLNMPLMNGVQTIEYIKQKSPHLKIVVVSMITSPLLVKQVINQGIDAYLFKTSGALELIKALKLVVQNKTYFPGSVKFSDSTRSTVRFTIDGQTVELSSREIQIIKLLSQGKSSEEIAGILFISPYTVRTHRKNIGAKLDTHTTAQLISFAIRHNIVSTI